MAFSYFQDFLLTTSSESITGFIHASLRPLLVKFTMHLNVFNNRKVLFCFV